MNLSDFQNISLESILNSMEVPEDKILGMIKKKAGINND